MITLQADFTDQPEHLPELIKRFEGGADLVVAERPADAPSVPQPVRRLRCVAPWVVRPFVHGAPASRDPFGALRLYRISVIRDLVKERGDAPIVRGRRLGANLDLLLRAAPLARRVETVALEPRYDVRRARDAHAAVVRRAWRCSAFARAARARSSREPVRA